MCGFGDVSSLSECRGGVCGFGDVSSLSGLGVRGVCPTRRRPGRGVWGVGVMCSLLIFLFL